MASIIRYFTQAKAGHLSEPVMEDRARSRAYAATAESREEEDRSVLNGAMERRAAFKDALAAEERRDLLGSHGDDEVPIGSIAGSAVVRDQSYDDGGLWSVVNRKARQYFGQPAPKGKGKAESSSNAKKPSALSDEHDQPDGLVAMDVELIDIDKYVEEHGLVWPKQPTPENPKKWWKDEKVVAKLNHQWTVIMCNRERPHNRIYYGWTSGNTKFLDNVHYVLIDEGVHCRQLIERKNSQINASEWDDIKSDRRGLQANFASFKETLHLRDGAIVLAPSGSGKSYFVDHQNGKHSFRCSKEKAKSTGQFQRFSGKAIAPINSQLNSPNIQERSSIESSVISSAPASSSSNKWSKEPFQSTASMPSSPVSTNGLSTSAIQAQCSESDESAATALPLKTNKSQKTTLRVEKRSCFKCGKSGHIVPNCKAEGDAVLSTFKSSSRGGRETRQCRSCGQHGHIARDCKSAVPARDLKSLVEEQIAREVEQEKGKIDAVNDMFQAQKDVIREQQEEIKMLHERAEVEIDREREVTNFSFQLDPADDYYESLKSKFTNVSTGKGYFNNFFHRSKNQARVLGVVGTGVHIAGAFGVEKGHLSSKVIPVTNSMLANYEAFQRPSKRIPYLGLVTMAAGTALCAAGAWRYFNPIEPFLRVECTFTTPTDTELSSIERRVKEMRIGKADVAPNFQRVIMKVTNEYNETVVDGDDPEHPMIISASLVASLDSALVRCKDVKTAIEAARHRVSATSSVALGADAENLDTVRSNSCYIAGLRFMRSSSRRSTGLFRDLQLN